MKHTIHLLLFVFALGVTSVAGAQLQLPPSPGEIIFDPKKAGVDLTGPFSQAMPNHLIYYLCMDNDGEFTALTTNPSTGPWILGQALTCEASVRFQVRVVKEEEATRLVIEDEGKAVTAWNQKVLRIQ